MSKASDPGEWLGEAEFTFKGTPFKITFDNMALLEAEGVLGVSLIEWLPRLLETIKSGGNPLMRDLAALVYGGLKNNHPKITQKEVVAMVLDRDDGLRVAINRAAAGIDIPEDVVAEVGNAPAPKANRKARRARKTKP